MDTQETTSTQGTQDKKITVDVPEDRLAEFYAFFGHFLAADRGRHGGARGRGRGGHGHGGHGPGGRHGGHRCGGRSAATEQAERGSVASTPDQEPVA